VLAAAESDLEANGLDRTGKQAGKIGRRRRGEIERAA
jgi:hypothetical protein